jgi:protein AbiQ
MQFNFLTYNFFKNNNHLKEIETKENRPYSVYVVTVNDLKFAIPLRSGIKHMHFYSSLGITKKEQINNIRNRVGNCGLDYSKALLLSDDSYIRKDVEDVYISEAEHNYLKGKEHIVKNGMERYIKKYIKAYDKQHIFENKMLCLYSTLQNYHFEIGLIDL